MPKYTQNGQYNLKRAELILEGGDRIDLRNSFLDISLYESILTPSMSGSISIIDSANEYNFSLLGNGEEIIIDFETAGAQTGIFYHGVVYKSSPPTRLSEHASGLILYFTSKERINSSRTIVGDSFNSESSRITKTLFDRIRNVKSIDIKDTKDIQKFVSAGHSPLQIISDLAGRSVSKNNEYGYLFYEDSLQFNFKPIQSLYQQEPVSSYFHKMAGLFDDVRKKEEESFNTIQDYEIVSVSDLLLQIDDGVYGSTSVNLNLLEKSIVENTYNNVDQFNVEKSLAKVPNLRNLTNPNNTDMKEVRVWFENQPFHKNRFHNIRELLNSQRYAAKIAVFGDTNNRAGLVINCILPIWGTNAKNNGKVPDPYSGRCLIAEIKHTIQKTNYAQSIKLIKDSFEVGS